MRTEIRRNGEKRVKLFGIDASAENDDLCYVVFYELLKSRCEL